MVYEKEKLFYRYEIRDTNTHKSDIANMENHHYATIVVHNKLNQDVTVYVYGNEIGSYVDSIQMGTTSGYPCSAGERIAISLTPDTTGWLPFVYITVVASSAPTSGYVNAYIYKYNP